MSVPDILKLNIEQYRAGHADLVRTIMQINSRMDNLRVRNGLHDESGGLAQDVFAELSATIEELQVTSEELRAQNEDLDSAQGVIASERERYMQLFQLAPMPYIVTDREGTIVEANEAASLMIGVDDVHLINKPLAVYFTMEHRRTYRRMLHALATKDRIRAKDLLVRSRTAREVPVAVTAARIASPPNTILWALTDLSVEKDALDAQQQLTAERELRKSAELDHVGLEFVINATEALAHVEDEPKLFERLVALATDGGFADFCAIFVQRDGEVVEVAFTVRIADRLPFIRILKSRYKVDAALPDTPISAVLKTGNAAFMPGLFSTSANAEDTLILDGLQRLGARYGMLIPIKGQSDIIGAILFLAESPRFSGRDYGIGTAIAKRTFFAVQAARTMHQLQEVNRSKTDFLAALSHELRTPLNSILGYADLLLAGVIREDHNIRDVIERIRDSGWHQLHLIEEIMTHARLDLGHTGLSASEINIQDLVRETAAVIQPLARSKGIEIRTVSSSAVITSDRTKLMQISCNLAANAVKFTRSGYVEIGAAEDGDGVRIWVTDSGPGISAEEVEHIFEPYWQANRSSLGVGLGLSISRRISTLLGGELSVRSEAGTGSTFTLHMPKRGG